VQNLKRNIKRVLKAIGYYLRKFWTTLVNYPESLLILLLATFGLSGILANLPNVIPLPAFVEAPMFAPVAAGLTMTGLIAYAKWREDNAQLS
jgi:hypothetical protein